LQEKMRGNVQRGWRDFYDSDCGGKMSTNKM